MAIDGLAIDGLAIDDWSAIATRQSVDRHSSRATKTLKMADGRLAIDKCRLTDWRSTDWRLMIGAPSPFVNPSIDTPSNRHLSIANRRATKTLKMADGRLAIDKCRLTDRRSTDWRLMIGAPSPLVNPSIDNPSNRHLSIANRQSPIGN
ncbi:MAG TPA: hypothetical protein VFK57_24160 [Vicinamibacterales bacterium]|nr:hypothetical protein [Vicinamibacterales bacterium]